MKIIKYTLMVLSCFLFDVLGNGLMGRLFFVTTPFLYSWYISFFMPRTVRVLAAFFVITQALLYSAVTPLFCSVVFGMLICSSFFNRLLRNVFWVRVLLTLILFFTIVFLLRYKIS